MKTTRLPQTREMKTNSLVFEVVRPQRKAVSRYKLKKQACLVQQIIDDLQVMNI